MLATVAKPKILRGKNSPKLLKELQSKIPLIDFLYFYWGDRKVTSFNLDKTLLKQIELFAKTNNSGIADIISLAVFEEIKLNENNRGKFKTCVIKEKSKSTVRLPCKVLELVCSFADENNCTKSDIINTSLCKFLNRYKQP